MNTGILNIADIDWLIRRINFQEDSLVCHKRYGTGVILQKDYEIMKNLNIFAENYWWVCFDNSTDGKVIRSVRADYLKSIKTKDEARYYNWDDHISKLVDDYRN